MYLKPKKLWEKIICYSKQNCVLWAKADGCRLSAVFLATVAKCLIVGSHVKCHEMN